MLCSAPSRRAFERSASTSPPCSRGGKIAPSPCEPCQPSPPPPTFSLTGKIVLLTGGAGIYGRGLAAQIAATGATLILASRNVEALEKVSAEERALGRNVHVRPLNLTEESSILQLRDSVLAEFGRIDGLVNNAVSRPMKSPDAPLADWEASMQANATGLFAITRAFADTMGAQGSGSIVNIGSIQGMVGPDFSLYEGLNTQAIPDYFFHKAGMVNTGRSNRFPEKPTMRSSDKKETDATLRSNASQN